MTDKKTIWHDSIQYPDLGKTIFGFFWDSDKWEIRYIDSTEIDDVAEFNCEKWCYLDDLLEISNNVESLESEVSRYKNALEVARSEYLAIIDSEFDSGDGEQIKAFMANYDKLIQDTIKASQ